VVLACGGFEANPEMRVKYLGSHWESAKVRGSRYNTGDGHRVALDVGAAPAGQWTGCHGTPIDADAPPAGDLPLTDAMPRRSYPLGIMVNVEGRRFIDEGASFAEQTFVRVGEAVLAQERSMAFQVFDARSAPLLEPRYGGSTPAMSDSIEGLSEDIGINPGVLRGTVDAYNAEAHDAEYAHRLLDGRSTRTLSPAKTNWAIRIDRPPFLAYRVTGGITYTYGGLKIDAEARVLDMEDRPIAGLYAAGEIVGGIFYHGSLRAAGLMHGSVFGRLGGAHAARLG
jgi:tricarballylate dehydrogenase